MSAFIASERLLSSVLEGLADPAILVDPGRRILASNTSFRVRFNAGEDPRGCYCFEMTHGRCSRCRCEDVARCPLEGRGVAGTLHHHTHCMGEAYEEVFAHPVEGLGGELSAYLLVTHPLSCSVQLVGRSQSFTRMMALVDYASGEGSPVLLRGETGSGRTCVARALHTLSTRSRGPFIIASCGAASEQVLRRELFGEATDQERNGRRRGLIESAHGGTLLLQGVDDLPVSLVPEVLEVISTGRYARVGESDRRQADVRWILVCRRATEFTAARALPSLVRIAVPPLRSRLEDLPILAEKMIGKFGDGAQQGISAEALTLLRQHPFPGNVRELEGLIERACLLASGERLERCHFPDLERNHH